ncbi:MAG: rod shape-determining protein MreC [Thermodesulfobacteriota bacterium]
MILRFRTIILIFLAGLVLVLVSYHSNPKREMSLPEKTLFEATGTIQLLMISSARSIEDFWRSYFYLVGLREENKRLREALDRSRAELNSLREDQLANQRLRELLKFAGGERYPYVGARVVGWDPGPWLKTLTVDRGSWDNVRKGAPVVSAQGVVGRVVDVAPHFSRVLLLVDYNSSIDAVIQRSRVRAILTGQGEKNCVLEYMRKDMDVELGDVVVTSGMGGAFPRGLLLGTVGGIKNLGYESFLQVSVTPAVDFSRLEEVLIVLSPEPPFEHRGWFPGPGAESPAVKAGEPGQ